MNEHDNTLPPRLTRRQALKTGLTAGAALTVASQLPRLATPALAQSGVESELVFACNGGSTQRIFEELFFPEFRKLHPGIKITYVPGQPAETVAKLRTQGAASGIDVAWLAGSATYTAIREGLVVDVDRSLIPTYASIPESVGDEKAAVPVGITICGLCSNAEAFKRNNIAPVASWFDMWDPKFRRHCGIYTLSVSATMAMFSLVAKLLTGDFKNFDAAFAKFRELRPNILDYFTTAGAWETAMQQGDLWLAMNNGARAMQLRAAGMPLDFTIPKEGGVGYQTWVGLAKGAPHPKAGHAWMEFLLSPPVQKLFSEKIGYMPVVSGVEIDPALRIYYPDLSEVFIPDWRFLSAEQPKLIDRWNREIER